MAPSEPVREIERPVPEWACRYPRADPPPPARVRRNARIRLLLVFPPAVLWLIGAPLLGIWEAPGSPAFLVLALVSVVVGVVGRNLVVAGWADPAPEARSAVPVPVQAALLGALLAAAVPEVTHADVALLSVAVVGAAQLADPWRRAWEVTRAWRSARSRRGDTAGP